MLRDMRQLVPTSVVGRPAAYRRSRRALPRPSRARIDMAAAIVGITFNLLRFAQRLFDAGFINLAGVEFAVRLSRGLRSLAQRLLQR